MEELKNIIAANMTALRKQAGLTQADIAAQLHYTDKAVSKWERGESIPDIAVLKELADIYGVTVDYLIREDHKDEIPPALAEHRLKNHGLITGISILLVCLIATTVFVTLTIAAPSGQPYWLSFLYALPVAMIVWLVLNSVWFNPRRNFLIVSLLMWSILLSLVTTLLVFCQPLNFNVLRLFLLGIPGQAIIWMWSHIRRKK